MSDAREKLDVRIEIAAGVAVVRLAGEIAYGNSPILLRSWQELAVQRPQKVIFDLAGVSYMDSSGVGTLVEIKRSIEKAGGKLFLAAIQPRVRGVFEITNLRSYFQIVADVDEARGK